MTDDIIECPCYPICSGLGLETGQWCRYRKSDLPPPGVRKFNPKDHWCPPGVQANALMLAHMLSEEKDNPDRLRNALERLRRSIAQLRSHSSTSYPSGQAAPPTEGD